MLVSKIKVMLCFSTPSLSCITGAWISVGKGFFFGGGDLLYIRYSLKIQLAAFLCFKWEKEIFLLLTIFFDLPHICFIGVDKHELDLTMRRHDMVNSLGDKTSCESSTPLAYSTLNVLALNGQWVLREMPLKFYSPFMLLS